MPRSSPSRSPISRRRELLGVWAVAASRDVGDQGVQYRSGPRQAVRSDERGEIQPGVEASPPLRAAPGDRERVERLLVADRGVAQRDDVSGSDHAPVDAGRERALEARGSGGHDDHGADVDGTADDPCAVADQFRATPDYLVARIRRALDDMHPGRIGQRRGQHQRELTGRRDVLGRQQMQHGLSGAHFGVVHPLSDTPGLLRPPARIETDPPISLGDGGLDTRRRWGAGPGRRAT